MMVDKIRELARICKRLSKNYTVEENFEIGFIQGNYWVTNGDFEYCSKDLEKALDEAISNIEYDVKESTRYADELQQDYSHDHYLDIVQGF